MPLIQEFTPCVQEGRQKYPDPDSSFKWDDVESVAKANIETILTCHEKDWITTTTGETYDTRTEFLAAVRFFQQAANAEGGERGEFKYSNLGTKRQEELFHDLYDIIYGYEPYKAPSRLSKWSVPALIFGAMGFVFSILLVTDPYSDNVSFKEKAGVVFGTTVAGAAMGVGIFEFFAYDRHASHWYSKDELMAIKTEVDE